jgi:hypothetical protein
MTDSKAGQIMGGGLQAPSTGTLTYSFSYLYDKAGSLETVTYRRYAKDMIHHASPEPASFVLTLGAGVLLV